MTYRKKLIEVSLPLEAINIEALQRKQKAPKGFPTSFHKWWAQRPLASCRAVLFSSLVDDPSEYMPDEESAHLERDRLFAIIEELVLWENSNNDEVMDKARIEIARSVARNLNEDVPVGKEAVREFLATKAPPVLDPFAGGGSIPLEAQRLGLRVFASDLNRVAVLINKALIEITHQFANCPPVHPFDGNDTVTYSKERTRANKKAQSELWQHEWKGAQGLAEDVRYYGNLMSAEALKRIGQFYPPIIITKEILDERPDLKKQGIKLGERLNVVAWLWARTVICPNPACNVEIPLVRSFLLSSKKGKEAHVLPITVKKSYTFKVALGKDVTRSTKIGRGSKFRCLSCNEIASDDYIKAEGVAHRMRTSLMSIVADSSIGRIYLSPTSEHEEITKKAIPSSRPEGELANDPRAIWCVLYGLKTFSDLYTDRQLLTFTTFSDLVKVVREIIVRDAKERGFSDDSKGLEQGGNGAIAYADAISVYLACIIDRAAFYGSSLTTWLPKDNALRDCMPRQGLPMVCDFAEANPFGKSSGDFITCTQTIANYLDIATPNASAAVTQNDAPIIDFENSSLLVSTDPPYYDNIGYADLSDYFYIWLRPSLKNILPKLMATLLVPKMEEIVAIPYRFGGSKNNARSFFEVALGNAFQRMQSVQNSDYPLSVYYAVKQSESDEEDDDDNSDKETVASTGWETMLEGLIKANFVIEGTWPLRTEGAGRMVARGTNALASSIILICRPRSQSALSTSRREFLALLKRELVSALRRLQQASIAPVDLAQAAIGPAMGVYSRYAAVLEADGKPMSVRTALTLINQALDEFLAEQEGEYDGDTRLALTWFEQYGHNEAAYGVAETLSRAKNTSVDGLSEAGILEARGGKVRLYRRDELDTDWDPTQDKRLTAWESAAHLIYKLENDGEESAAELLAKLGPVAEVARDLAYRLYTVCERKGWSQDALGYNMLVVAWPRLKELAAQQKPKQASLL